MKTIFFTLFVLVASCVFANPVDVKTASLVAENYYNSNAKVKASNLSLTYQEVTNTGDTAIYYVFNINQSDGWIIVAATDASYPVLGYSPSGNYSKQDQPPAFIYWMEGYKNQILDIIRRRISPTTEINAEWATYKSLEGGSSNKSPLSVGPLLSTTWNQGQYYNAWCPGGCPTGCVATAMAQIMKYWGSPTMGTGDHCYQHPSYGQICANFGITTYNWGAMPNNVTSSNTPVATLMYHCGVSVNMDYCQNGTNVSGAWVLTNDPNGTGYHPNSAQNAYPTYFSYDQNTIQGKLRVNYSDSYWINSVLKPELDATIPRPIQYVGWDVNGQGGHTWVCDGYNSNSYFHMNWGWGGTNDGWFSINNLNPGNYHFDNGQQALIGIKPGSNGDNTMCGNDNCNDAVILTSLTTCQNTLCSVDNATPDNFNVPSCDSYYPPSNILGAGVHFKFTAVNTSHTIRVTPTGTLDAIIVVYSGGCYNLIEVPGGCMDTPGGNGVITTLTVNNLIPGVEYTIRVYDYGSANAASGGFNICVTHAGGYAITTQSSPSNGGTTSGGGTFPSGTYITVSANQNTGYTFNNWTENGNVVSSNSNYSFTVAANRVLVANFTQNPVNYTVTTQSSPSNGGTASGGGTFPSGTYITVSANQNTGYTFSNWTENGNVVSSNNNYSFTVTSNRTLVANFTQNPVNYTVSTQSSPANGGTTSGGGTFPSGTYITVSANQNTGYTFSNWTENGNVVSSNNNYSFTMTSNRTLVANFTQNPVNYTVSTQSSPANGGTTSGGGTFPSGTYITVSANQNTGYTFTNWTENGNVVSTNSNYSFTVTANRTLIANFTQNPVNYTVTTQSSPPNGGTTSGGGSFLSGTYITVSANQNTGYTFSNWTENGNVVSSNTNYSFTVISNRTLVANFTQNPANYTITTQSSPSNGGTTSGGGTFPSGTYVTVSANQNNGYTFVNWTENGNVVNSNINYSFTVNTNRTLVANFTQNTVNYTVTTQSSPSNGGTTSGGGTFPSGTYITVLANNSNGYTFSNWSESGNVVSTNSNYSFTVTSNRTLVANFTQNVEYYTVTTQSSPSNGGTTSGGGTFPSGTYITVLANNSNGYTFSNWSESGNVVSTNSNYSFAVTATRTLVANFTANSQNMTKPTFAKLYDDFNDLHTFNGVIDFAQSEIDSSYLVGGQYSYTGSSNDGFYYYKVDKNGTLIWVKEISYPNSVIHSIVKSANGYMISFGLNNEAAIMEIDEEGNVLWSKKLNLYIQNFTTTQGGYIGTYSFMNTLNLVKLDLVGNLVWSKIFSYSISNGEYAHCEKLASDYYGNIYLLGGYQNPNSFSSQNGIIQKVSSDGNPIWSKQISTYDNYSDKLTGLVIDNYSNLYFSLMTNDNSGAFSNGYIGKLNSSGSLSSLKQLPGSISPMIFSISPTGDNVQAWYAKDFQTTILSLDSDIDITELKTIDYQGLWIAKGTLDHNIMLGGSESTYSLNGSNDIHFNMFKVSMNQISCIDAPQQNITLLNSSVNVNTLDISTANSEVTLADFTMNPINTILLDSAFCDDSGIFTTVEEIMPRIGKENAFSIFPNPTTDRFTLKALDVEKDKYWLEIIDVTGRTGKRLIVNTVDGHIYQTIDVDDLPDGIYMLRIGSSGYNQSLKLILQ